MLSRTGIFCEAIRLGSFTKAAELCGYSQSAVSQNVKALEQELGFVLVDRRKDGIRLTADGERFFPYLRDIYAAERALGERRREALGLEGSRITVGTFTSVSRTFLPRLMGAFKAQHPAVSFCLRQGDHTTIPAWIREGSVDLGFINSDRETALPSVPLYRDEFMAVLPPSHPLAQKEEVTLAELAAEQVIQLGTGQVDTLEAFRAAGLSPRSDYEIYDDYTVLEMVRQGLGIALLYEHFLHGLAGGLAVRPIREHPGRNIALAWRNAETLPYAAKRFAQFLKKSDDWTKKSLDR